MNDSAHAESQVRNEAGFPIQSAGALPPAWVPILLLSGLKFVANLLSHPEFGYFRDELYYLDCANRLDWGYVDHPPLSIALLAFFKSVLGTELWAVRLPSALAGGCTVFLSGLLAWRMGGGRFAQSLCALAVLVSPLMLGVDSFYSMNVFDRLFWIALVYLVVRAITTADARYWIWFGVVAGLGLQNKYSVAFLGIGLLAGLLLTKHRRFLKTREIWIGAALMALIVLPHLIWQVRHGFPTLEFMENATRFKMAKKSLGDFAMAQVLEMHPLNAPIWIIGLVFGLLSARASEFRILSIMFLVVFAILGLQGGKAYYLSPAFPAMLALGAICIEQWMRSRPWVRSVAILMLVASGALLSTLALPIVSPATNLRMSRALGLSRPA